MAPLDVQDVGLPGPPVVQVPDLPRHPVGVPDSDDGDGGHGGLRRARGAGAGVGLEDGGDAVGQVVLLDSVQAYTIGLSPARVGPPRPRHGAPDDARDGGVTARRAVGPCRLGLDTGLERPRRRHVGHTPAFADTLSDTGDGVGGVGLPPHRKVAGVANDAPGLAPKRDDVARPVHLATGVGRPGPETFLRTAGVRRPATGDRGGHVAVGVDRPSRPGHAPAPVAPRPTAKADETP